MDLRRLVRFIALPALAVACSGAPTSQQLIDQLKMKIIPGEGAWFVQTYSNPESIEGQAASHVAGPHHAYSAIYALETAVNFSALHRLATDELWHFYGGVPLELLLLYPEGHGETVVVGQDVLAGQRPQFLVPKGVWQGSRPLGHAADAYSFFGTTMTPGFDYTDYEQGYRDELQGLYPAFTDKIAALTRDEFVHRKGTLKMPVVTPPPLELLEIVGRTASAHSERVSVAFFRLQPGAASALSYNHEGEEIFIVSSGRGGVLRGTARTPVSRGSVIYVEPSTVRSVKADEREVLEFYAVTAPAWSPEDDVHVEP
jgi:predicted cupin superfamily sugar epimerase/mannose-6-phosphate isomerase-like protein (cupin superfamily)